VMAQSLKIPRGDKICFIDVAREMDDAQLTNDPTLSTAGKTIENTSFYKTVTTPMRFSVNLKPSAQSRASSR